MQELSPNHWCCYIDGSGIDGASDDGNNIAGSDDGRISNCGVATGDIRDDNHMTNVATTVEELPMAITTNNLNNDDDNSNKNSDQHSPSSNSIGVESSPLKKKKRDESCSVNDVDESSNNESSSSVSESFKRFKPSNSSDCFATIDNSDDGEVVADDGEVVDEVVLDTSANVIVDDTDDSIVGVGSKDDLVIGGNSVMESSNSNSGQGSSSSADLIRVNSYTFINSTYYVNDNSNEC